MSEQPSLIPSSDETMARLAIALHDHAKAMREFMAAFPNLAMPTTAEPPMPAIALPEDDDEKQDNPPARAPLPVNTPIMDKAVLAVQKLVDRCNGVADATSLIHRFWSSPYKAPSFTAIENLANGKPWSFKHASGWGPMLREARMIAIIDCAGKVLSVLPKKEAKP